MPGAAAKAAGVRSSVIATVSARSSFVFDVGFCMFIGLIAALLIAGVSKRVAGHAVANVDLGHHPAEVLRVVGQHLEIWGVDVESAARWIQLCGASRAHVGTAAIVTGVQNHVE